MLLRSIGPGHFGEQFRTRTSATLTCEETEEITCPEKQSTISGVVFGATSNKQARSKRHLAAGYRSI